MIDKDDINQLIYDLIKVAVTRDYAMYITEEIIDDVLRDVTECADADYSDDDVRYAIGRVLCEKLGIEY